MPRLPPSLVYYASRQNPLLSLLLRECRDLESARNELRWLSEHALASNLERNKKIESSCAIAPAWSHRSPAWPTLFQNVIRRSRGEPLQYILGTQPFGELDILCRKNVLIPRYDTATYTTKLAGLLCQIVGDHDTKEKRSMRIIDICTGSGCIALLLHSLLKSSNGFADRLSSLELEILGVDISQHALNLARENLKHNVKEGLLHATAVDDVGFQKLNILDFGNQMWQTGSEEYYQPPVSTVEDVEQVEPESVNLLGRFQHAQAPKPFYFDVVISNPPYISPTQFLPGGTTTRSVRNHEPKLALVPPPLPACSEGRSNIADQGDVFYPSLAQLARYVGAKVLVMEVGDAEQAYRVLDITRQIAPDSVFEVWRDDGSVHGGEARESAGAAHKPDAARQAEDRAVVVWRGDWAEWRRRHRAQ